MSEIERKVNIPCNQFVNYGAVINPVNGNEPASRITIVQFVADGFQAGNVHDGDAKLAGGDLEVRKRFLMKGIHFGDYDVLWSVLTHHRAPQQLPIAVLIQ